MYVYLMVCSRASRASGKMGQELWEAPASCLSWCVYILSEIRHRDTLMYVLAVCVSEGGSTEVGHPSHIAASTARAVPFTFPQWVV